MLNMDKNSRVKPLQALEHPFLSIEDTNRRATDEDLTTHMEEASTRGTELLVEESESG